MAEGVEDADTLAFVHAAGADLAQGYHIARPLAAADLTAWLECHPGPDGALDADGPLGPPATTPARPRQFRPQPVLGARRAERAA